MNVDFPTAVDMSAEIENLYPTLMVAGFRRTSFERPNDSWAVDIVDPETGRLTTLDEKDDWEGMLQRAYPLVARRA
jgi:hypothetical protein